MDVSVTTTIAAPPATVARIMFEPEHDPRWIGGAQRVIAVAGVSPAIGARVRREGSFLTRPIAWVTEVVDFEPDRRLRMRFVEGPMKGEVTYELAPASGGTLVTVRNQGETSWLMPFMATMVRRSVTADLARLKGVVEG
jgi:uncharacterized protein YndB with AHSA1/START domain